MTYSQTISDLQEKVFKRGVNYNLDNLLNFLDLLGNPHLELNNVIHIAGTNGKGSTMTFIASALKEAGYIIGTFSSPHIHCYTERICLDNEPIPKDIFSTIFNNIRKLSGFDLLTEFEVIMVISILYFIWQQTDFLIYETGLGGRLDFESDSIHYYDH